MKKNIKCTALYFFIKNLSSTEATRQVLACGYLVCAAPGSYQHLILTLDGSSCRRHCGHQSMLSVLVTGGLNVVALTFQKTLIRATSHLMLALLHSQARWSLIKLALDIET